MQHVDAVLYTHPHADHIHGIDDLRGFFHNAHQRVPIYADPFTMERIRQGFGYCIETPPDSNYPPIVEPILIEDLDTPIAHHRRRWHDLVQAASAAARRYPFARLPDRRGRLLQ